jgi:hypothetical protein
MRTSSVNKKGKYQWAKHKMDIQAANSCIYSVNVVNHSTLEVRFAWNIISSNKKL